MSRSAVMDSMRGAPLRSSGDFTVLDRRKRLAFSAVVGSTITIVELCRSTFMAVPKLTALELRIMEAVWKHGACSVREIQEAFPAARRPAYTTVQTTVYRLEAKKALRRVKKISNAHIFEAVLSPQAARGRLVDELLNLFGG